MLKRNKDNLPPVAVTKISLHHRSFANLFQIHAQIASLNFRLIADVYLIQKKQNNNLPYKGATQRCQHKDLTRVTNYYKIQLQLLI